MQGDSSEVSAGGVVVLRDYGKTFVALVEKHDGSWVIPKGHVQSGETLERAALREIGEETGLLKSELKVERKLGTVNFNEHSSESPTEKENHFFLVSCSAPLNRRLVTDGAHKSAAWIELPVHGIAMAYRYQAAIIEDIAKQFGTN